MVRSHHPGIKVRQEAQAHGSKDHLQLGHGRTLHPDPPSAAPLHTPVHFTTARGSTDEILLRFWETEDVPSTPDALTSEEKGVTDHYQKYCVYLPTGRFKAARRTDAPALGESRRQHALQSNERSVLRKGNWAAFQEVVQEYLDLGHAKPVPPTSISSPASSHYYLPIHGVVKNSSTSTKFRVVFDASAKTTSRVSLNDTLLVGPTLFKPIDHIVAISGDIGKM